MGARSSAPPDGTLTAEAGRRPFPLGRLLIGLLLVAVVVAPLILALARLRQPPDAGRLVYVAEQDVRIRDLAGGAQESGGSLPHGARFAVASPEGDRIAYLVRPGEVQVLDVRSGERETIRVQGHPVSWTPNGRLMLVTQSGGDSHLVVPVDGDDVSRLMLPSLLPPGPWRLESEPVWLERDIFAVSIRERGSPPALWVVDVADAEPRIVHRIERAFPLVGSPDGRQLLFTRGESGDMSLEILSIRHLESEEVARASSFAGGSLSRRGLVALWGFDRGSPALWLLSPVDSELHPLLGEGALPLHGGVNAVAWSIDGSHLVFVEGDRIRTIGVDGADLKTIVEGARPEILAVARWTP